MYSKSFCLLFFALSVLSSVQAAPALHIRHDSDGDSDCNTGAATTTAQATISASSITTSSAPTSTATFSLLQNALEAQRMNIEFAKLNGTESCTPFDQACIKGKYAVCTSEGKFDIRDCFSPETVCAAIPRTYRAGADLDCKTHAFIVESFRNATLTHTGPVFGLTNSTEVDYPDEQSGTCDEEQDAGNTDDEGCDGEQEAGHTDEQDCNSESQTIPTTSTPKTVKSATPAASVTTVFVTVTAGPGQDAPSSTVLKRRQLTFISESSSSSIVTPSSLSIGAVVPVSISTSVAASSAPVLSLPTIMPTTTVSSIPVITPTVVIGTNGIVTVTVVSTSIVTVSPACTPVTLNLPSSVSVTSNIPVITIGSSAVGNNSGVFSLPVSTTITNPFTFDTTSSVVSTSTVPTQTSSAATSPSVTSTIGGGFGDFSNSFTFAQATST